MSTTALKCTKKNPFNVLITILQQFLRLILKFLLVYKNRTSPKLLLFVVQTNGNFSQPFFRPLRG